MPRLRFSPGRKFDFCPWHQSQPECLFSLGRTFVGGISIEVAIL